MYALIFDCADEIHRARYENCCISVMMAKDAPHFSEWDDVIELLKKLKKAGVETKKVLGNGNEVKIYELKEAGGVTISLQRGEYKTLVGYMKQPIWLVGGIEAAKECVTWLEGLKPEEDTPKATD